VFNHAEPSSVPSIVTVGNLLTIEKERRYGVPDSEGGSGYVDCVHADGTFDIKFTISGAVEKNVQPSRILNSNPLATSSRRRSSLTMVPQQDLLSYLPIMSRLLGAAAYLQLQLRPTFQQLPQIIHQLLVTIIFDRCPFTFIKFSYIVLIGTRSEVWRIHLWLCWSGERSGDQQVGGRGWKILVSRSGGEGHNKRACLQTDGT